MEEMRPTYIVIERTKLEIIITDRYKKHKHEATRGAKRNWFYFVPLFANAELTKYIL